MKLEACIFCVDFPPKSISLKLYFILDYAHIECVHVVKLEHVSLPRVGTPQSTLINVPSTKVSLNWGDLKNHY